MKERIYILLGSNLGNRENNLMVALGKLSAIAGIEIAASSGIYNSPAMEMSEPSPDFLNQVIEINTSLAPLQLLEELKAIETKMGRVDKGKYKSRPIDLDILLFGERIIESEELVIPQARLLQRPFALIPLLEIAPDILHPFTKTPIKQYIHDSDYKQVTPHEAHAASHS